MRTTVSIDDAVLRAAKQRATEEGRTLGDLITEALRARLAPRAPTAREPFRMITDGEGGPLPGVDVTSNASLRDRMGEEG